VTFTEDAKIELDLL